MIYLVVLEGIDYTQILAACTSKKRADEIAGAHHLGDLAEVAVFEMEDGHDYDWDYPPKKVMDEQ